MKNEEQTLYKITNNQPTLEYHCKRYRLFISTSFLGFKETNYTIFLPLFLLQQEKKYLTLFLLEFA